MLCQNNIKFVKDSSEMKIVENDIKPGHASLVEVVYYYSQIFPGSWAQHCNYATLLAGRYGNNLWYSVIFRMGPFLYSRLV